MLELCLILKSMWATDWHPIIPVPGRPTPRVPSKRILLFTAVSSFAFSLGALGHDVQPQ
jgi:hypothetical protein